MTSKWCLFGVVHFLLSLCIYTFLFFYCTSGPLVRAAAAAADQTGEMAAATATGAPDGAPPAAEAGAAVRSLSATTEPTEAIEAVTAEGTRAAAPSAGSHAAAVTGEMANAPAVTGPPGTEEVVALSRIAIDIVIITTETKKDEGMRCSTVFRCGSHWYACKQEKLSVSVIINCR